MQHIRESKENREERAKKKRKFRENEEKKIEELLLKELKEPCKNISDQDINELYDFYNEKKNFNETKQKMDLDTYSLKQKKRKFEEREEQKKDECIMKEIIESCNNCTLSDQDINELYNFYKEKKINKILSINNLEFN